MYARSMSDLALPFLLILEDDVLAFWCFTALMDKVGRPGGGGGHCHRRGHARARAARAHTQQF